MNKKSGKCSAVTIHSEGLDDNRNLEKIQVTIDTSAESEWSELLIRNKRILIFTADILATNQIYYR